MKRMSTPDHGDWELINAYADGELSAEDRARLARRLATDPALEASLEEVQTLKAKLAHIRPVTAGQSSKPVGGARRFYRAIRVPAAAAAAVALMMFGIIQHLQHASTGDWRDITTQLHDELSGNAYILGPSSPVTAISTGAMGDLSAFDLSPSRLALVDVRNVRVEGVQIVAMHYRGHNGCSLTIAVTNAAAGDGPLKGTRAGLLEAHWTAGAIQYLVVASGMDRARFEAIANYARAESLRRDGREELRIAVRSATDHARPCA